MSAYPVVYDQSPPVKRSRVTVFFRALLAIPHLIWLTLYGLGAYIAAFCAWLVLLFTAKFPQGLYDFLAGYLRYTGRVCAYLLLIVDDYPPFDGGEHSEYPVRIKIGPPQSTYSRLLVFFRLILAIPIFILQYVFEIWLFAVAIAIWFVAVIMGNTSPGLTEAMRFPMSYYVRSSGYVYLLTDKYPPVSDTESMPHLANNPM
jgi:hypothetical protein